MEETPEGLAAAAATRDAAKRKRAAGANEEEDAEAPPPKRLPQSAALLRHEVAVPRTQHQQSDSSPLDPELHGAQPQRLHACGPFLHLNARRRRTDARCFPDRHSAGAAVARGDGQAVPFHAGPFPEHRHRLFGAFKGSPSPDIHTRLSPS